MQRNSVIYSITISKSLTLRPFLLIIRTPTAQALASASKGIMGKDGKGQKDTRPCVAKSNSSQRSTTICSQTNKVWRGLAASVHDMYIYVFFSEMPCRKQLRVRNVVPAVCNLNLTVAVPSCPEPNGVAVSGSSEHPRERHLQHAACPWAWLQGEPYS